MMAINDEVCSKRSNVSLNSPGEASIATIVNEFRVMGRRRSVSDVKCNSRAPIFLRLLLLALGDEDPVSLDALQQRLEEVKQRRKEARNHIRKKALVQASLQEHLNQSILAQEHALLDYRSVLLQKKRATCLLQLSQQWNVLSDCFQISHRGSFGTINGLRLGVTPTNLDDESSSGQPNSNNNNIPRIVADPTGNSNTVLRVPWMEINAALGHVVLLLSTLESRPFANIVLRHQLLPMGSTSKIGIRKGLKSVSLYNLFHSDDISFQFFGKRNFNIALSCLIECVQDAVEAIQSRDRSIAVPHIIERQRDVMTIGGLPVSYGTDGGVWTRAMKYLLTDLKHLLSYRLLFLWNT
jgi:beclin